MYLSSDEFLDLERARLTLRAHEIGVDRGRLVREAIALLMTDLEAGIDASVIANRLRAAGTPDPADDGPVANGALVDGALADGAWVDRDLTDTVRVDGALADGGSINGGFAGGGPVAGVLASAIGVTGPPEGPQ